MKKKVGVALIAGMLAAPTPALAQGLGEVSKGDFEGEVGGHWQWEKPRDDSAASFAVSYASFLYETPQLHGLNLGLGAHGSAKLYERDDDHYKDAITKNLLLHSAFLRYQHQAWGSLTLGRQEVDLEWLNDYVEGGRLALTPQDHLEISLGWARRQAVADPDEVEDFEKMNDSRGLYLLDVKYSPLAWLELNPYYYHAPRMFRAPGLRIGADYELSEQFTAHTMAQFATSTPHADTGADNGDLFWLEQGLSFRELALSAGYIQVDRQGSGLLDSFGDQQPLEEGNQVFEPDARTFYLAAAYQVGPVTLEAMYGQTRYDDAGDQVKEQEWNLVAGYQMMENLELELMYINIDHDDRAESYHAVKAGLAYHF